MRWEKRDSNNRGEISQGSVIEVGDTEVASRYKYDITQPADTML